VKVSFVHRWPPLMGVLRQPLYQAKCALGTQRRFAWNFGACKHPGNVCKRRLGEASRPIDRRG
jgi:hypothetical protein